MNIAICIPVRNEAERLSRLFTALDRLETDAASSVRLCLLLDGCTDDSADHVESYRVRSRWPVHVTTAAQGKPNAGLARHRAMVLGLDALDSQGGVLLTTDADSHPDENWISRMIDGLNHADVVTGNVIREQERPCPNQDRIEAYFSQLHAWRRQLDPLPWEAPRTHYHSSGANMGMRAETYVGLGGFLPIRSGEDALLCDHASRVGLRVRRDADSVVYTSSRRQGRANGGMATGLRELDLAGLDGVVVAHPADSGWQYAMHAAARCAYDKATFASLSQHIGLDADHLLGVARDCPNAEAFAARVVPVPPGGMRQVPFVVAEAALAERLGAADIVAAA